MLRGRVVLGGGIGRGACAESATLRLRGLGLWATGRCVYHALAVGRDSFCEDCVAQLCEVFLRQVAVCAFQQQLVQVRHGGGLCARVVTSVGVDVDVKLGGSAGVSWGAGQGFVQPLLHLNLCTMGDRLPSPPLCLLSRGAAAWLREAFLFMRHSAPDVFPSRLWLAAGKHDTGERSMDATESVFS